MRCPNCASDNPSDAKFCENCGQPLERVCPNCGQPVSPQAKFCKNCGHNLAGAPAVRLSSPKSAARPAPVTRSDSLDAIRQATPQTLASKILAERERPEGERKIVTALFTDIVGSTTLAEQMDPEYWREIVSGAHRCVSEAVYRYEGTIAQLLGDGVLAFFGAPLAHEDDPERAIRAALDILAAIQDYAGQVRRKYQVSAFQMRVGMNTGLVVVGHIGSDLHMEYLAVGDTVNLAARMQSAAEPDTVLISENTHRLVAKLFEFEDRGKISVKGKAEPVQVYRVLGERKDAVRARGIEGLYSPLVGRERELEVLQSRVDELGQGRGQIVSVIGEAGLGKSRLVAELRQALAASGRLAGALPAAENAGIAWYEGRCLSYQAATPYALFQDLLAGLLGLRAEAAEADKYIQVRAQVATIFPGREAEIAPFVATLLRITPTGEDYERVRYLEPPQLRQRISQATLDLMEGLAAKQPLVLVLEDIHWIDPSSLDLLGQMMDVCDRATLMILALFRPRRQEPSWRFHEIAGQDYPQRYTSLTLAPLDESQSRALVGNLLHIEDLPEKVRALILKKAEGNPFFVEEVIRSLLDSKLVVRENSHWRATREIENIAVPDTLAGVITARLDRLGDDSKRMVQTASVIGREFQQDILSQVSEAPRAVDGALGDLQRRELILEKSPLPDRAFLFKHALTHETAYASLLLSKRHELHRRVAECLERTDKERVDDIARHFWEAGEKLRALPYLVQAGERAIHAYAIAEAISYYTQALQIIQTGEGADPSALPAVAGQAPSLPSGQAPSLPSGQVLARRVYEGLGRARMLASDLMGAVENYQAMLQVARGRDDVPMQVSALNKLSDCLAYLGQFEEVEKNLLEAERLGREYRDRPGLVELYTLRCGMCTFSGDFEGAVKYLGESVEIGRELNVKEQMAFGLTHTANTLTFMTRFDEAWQTAQEAYQVAQEVGDLQHLSEVLASPMAAYHLRNGNLDAARRAAEEGTNIGDRVGLAYPTCVGDWMLGSLAHIQGDYERAIAHYQKSVQAGRASGMVFFEVMPLGSLGTVYLDISAAFLPKVNEYHLQTLKLMEHPMGAAAGGAAWVELGFCVLAKGDLDHAEEFFQKGLTVPTTQWLLNRPRFLIGMAFVHLARGRTDEAGGLVDQAHAFVEERAMKYLFPLVDFADAQVCAARGESERALEQFGRAEELAAAMQMRPLVWQAQAGAAAVMSALGRAAEAEAKRRQARTVIDEIAGLFEDEELGEMFAESALGKTG